MSTRELPGWCRETDAGLEVGYSVICPDVCPPGLAELIAGRIEAGVFYPYGTVARCLSTPNASGTAERRSNDRPMSTSSRRSGAVR